MRVVAIRGCNLASLSGEFAIELDRPPLSTLGLFAIHGPVGAGKSTLLDALCLGLYGRTPRLSGVGGAPVGDGEGADELRSNDPRTLVRRGASLSFAEVDFTGLDGRLYRARWEVKRAKARGAAKLHGIAGVATGRLQAEKMSLIDVVNNQRIGDTNTSVRAAIEARLGLSFDELCRSVLLAQGGFQGFLQARPAERGELLEKVTGTALYTRLSIAAHEKARRLRDHEQALVVARTALHVLDDAERQLRDAAAIAASFDACAAEDEAARASADLEAARAARARARAVDEARRAVLKAQTQVSSSDERVLRASEAQAASSVERDRLRPLLDRARLLDARVQASSLATAQPDRDRAVVIDDAARQALADIQARFDDASARQRSAGAALDGDAALAAVSAYVAVKDAVVAGLQRLERARLEVAGVLAILAASSLAVSEADVVVSEADRSWRAAVPRRPKALHERSLAGVLAGLLGQIVVDEEQRQLRLSADVDVARRVRDRLARALSKTAERALLEDGEACPVCGSLEHPFAHGGPLDAVVDEERARIAALEAEQRQSLERLVHARQRTNSLGPVEVVQLESSDVDVDVVEALIARERLADDAARALEDARALREDRVRDEAFQREALAAKEAVVVDVEGHLLGLGLRPADLEQPRARANAIAADIARFEKARAAHAAAGADVVRLAHEHGAVVVRAEVAAGQRAAAHAAFVAWQVDHQALIAERAAVLDDDVAAVEGRLQAARAEADLAVDDARAARAQAAALLARATAVLEERLAPPVAGGGEPAADVDVDVVEAAAVVARARAVAAREAHALLRAALAHDAQLVERARVLDEQLAAHRTSSQVWWELGQVIGSADGARFRQFAQGLTLDALVVHANEHLKTLAPRYRLQRVSVTNARHDLDLVVVDTESGDEVRSTSTLSGGESFLVSLSLALGLSSLSANEGARGRVETLFIDEGFSALDADTLDVALTAFDALRQTGRQIGVISHVPLLVERIGAQVRVIPTGGGASRVEVRSG